MRIIKTCYTCDWCEREIGLYQNISICMGPYAGIVKPPKWKNIKRLEIRPYHFCDIDNCLTPFLVHNCTKKEFNLENPKENE